MSVISLKQAEEKGEHGSNIRKWARGPYHVIDSADTL